MSSPAISSRPASDSPNTSDKPSTQDDKKSTLDDKKAKFKALLAKKADSIKANHTDVIAEHRRLKFDVSQMSKIERKKADAELKLAKQDAEEAGDDYERKRAWDWTIEESLRWDERTREKAQNRDKAGFADYTQHAEKAYGKNIQGFKPDLEAYQKAKEEALSKGQLVTTAEGEIVAVDEDRIFYADANSLGITDHKPTKAALDKLVEETKKREAEREAKRRKTRARQDDGEVSFINKRNQVFNQKLSRFYDQYTRETREAFERGSGV